MSTTITIPAKIVPEAREGTVYTLGQVAHEVWHQSERRDGDLGPALERFDTVRGLLDAIGAAQGAVEVDERHKPILIEMMEDHTRAMAQLLDDERKAGNTDEVDRYAPRVKNLTAYAAVLSVAGGA